MPLYTDYHFNYFRHYMLHNIMKIKCCLNIYLANNIMEYHSSRLTTQFQHRYCYQS